MNTKLYIKHFADLQEPSLPEDYESKSNQTIGSNFSKFFGLTRLGIHHITVKPGCRTSSPHAESLEEEFVYVLSGTPHAWINGYLYKLSPGWAIGFPAGTGIAHTFINNSINDAQLLVVGEKTKKENRCSFPINPELKATSNIWWENAPQHILGSHNGLPGPFMDSVVKKDYPPFATYVPDLMKSKSFHYPGDNETFGEGIRLSTTLGLKSLGVSFELLAPGQRSAYPHAHTHEEEFAYILDGQPTAWLNGETELLKSGEAIAFIPNTNVAHCLINNTDSNITYIGIGEAQDFPDEKIIYPLNPLRNKECHRKNWYWTNPPKIFLGPHSGTSQKTIPDHLKFRLCTEHDAKEILAIYESSPSYFQKVDGCAPNLKTVEHALSGIPQKTGTNYFKEFLIIEYNQKPIGVTDLHCNHPDNAMTYIGLLLISENLFGQGLGRKCYNLVEDYIKRAFESKSIRLGISDANDISDFWMAMGFKPNGKSYPWQGENKTTNIIEYEKSI